MTNKIKLQNMRPCFFRKLCIATHSGVGIKSFTTHFVRERQRGSEGDGNRHGSFLTKRNAAAGHIHCLAMGWFRMIYMNRNEFLFQMNHSGPVPGFSFSLTSSEASLAKRVVKMDSRPFAFIRG